MKKRYLAIALAVGVVASAALLPRLGPPHLLRTRTNHWLYADSLSALAEELCSNWERFDWVGLVDGVVQAGSNRDWELDVPLTISEKEKFHQLFESASLYYLASFSSNDSVGAHIRVASGVLYGKQYWVEMLYNSQPRETRRPCTLGYLDSVVGDCFEQLDDNWIYELSWIDEDYEIPGEGP